MLDYDFWSSELSDIDISLTASGNHPANMHIPENHLTYLELIQEHEGKSFDQLPHEYDIKNTNGIPIQNQFFPFFKSLQAFSRNICEIQINDNTFEGSTIDGTTYGIVTIKTPTATIEIAILTEVRYKNTRAFYIQITDNALNVYRLIGEGTARKRIQESLNVASNIDLENPTLVAYNLLAMVNKWISKTDI